jgi:hypothetical protein
LASNPQKSDVVLVSKEQGASGIENKQSPSTRYVAALSGNRIDRLSYQIPRQDRDQILLLLSQTGYSGDSDNFIQEIENLIGRYQTLKSQDVDLEINEPEAIRKLRISKRRLTDLKNNLDQINKNKHGVMRLRAAWGKILAARHTQPMLNPMNPYSIQPIFTALEDLEKLLSLAIAFPRKAIKGGRLPATRQKGFVREFYQLCQNRFQKKLLPITGGPLKKIISISMKQVGWPSDDIRHLLNIQKPKGKR